MKNPRIAVWKIVSLVLTLCFVPGAIPAYLAFASQRFLVNTKIIYSPLVVCSTIFVLASAAG